MFLYVFLCFCIFSNVFVCFHMFILNPNLFRNEVFIGLQFCWDGADMFEFSGKSIWPLAVSILNFPKDLRDKMNIGLHVVAMCIGICLFCIFSYVSCLLIVLNCEINVLNMNLLNGIMST